MELGKNVLLALKTSKHFVLRDQMTRAAVSISSNIAEGFERNSPKQFSYFLKVAKGSCAELRSQVHLAKAVKAIDPKLCDGFHEKCLKISKMLGSLIETQKKFMA